MVHNLQGKEVFITLDLKSSYYQFQVNPVYQHKLRFTFQKQAYLFQGHCFGLKMGTTLFSKIRDTVLRVLKDFTECCIDDIIVYKLVEAHIKQVQVVIDH